MAESKHTDRRSDHGCIQPRQGEETTIARGREVASGPLREDQLDIVYSSPCRQYKLRQVPCQATVEMSSFSHSRNVRFM